MKRLNENELMPMYARKKPGNVDVQVLLISKYFKEKSMAGLVRGVSKNSAVRKCATSLVISRAALSFPQSPGETYADTVAVMGSLDHDEYLSTLYGPLHQPRNRPLNAVFLGHVRTRYSDGVVCENLELVDSNNILVASVPLPDTDAVPEAIMSALTSNFTPGETVVVTPDDPLFAPQLIVAGFHILYSPADPAWMEAYVVDVKPRTPRTRPGFCFQDHGDINYENGNRFVRVTFREPVPEGAFSQDEAMARVGAKVDELLESRFRKSDRALSAQDRLLKGLFIEPVHTVPGPAIRDGEYEFRLEPVVGYSPRRAAILEAVSDGLVLVTDIRDSGLCDPPSSGLDSIGVFELFMESSVFLADREFPVSYSDGERILCEFSSILRNSFISLLEAMDVPDARYLMERTLLHVPIPLDSWGLTLKGTPEQEKGFNDIMVTLGY